MNTKYKSRATEELDAILGEVPHGVGEPTSAELDDTFGPALHETAAEHVADAAFKEAMNQPHSYGPSYNDYAEPSKEVRTEVKTEAKRPSFALFETSELQEEDGVHGDGAGYAPGYESGPKSYHESYDSAPEPTHESGSQPNHEFESESTAKPFMEPEREHVIFSSAPPVYSQPDLNLGRPLAEMTAGELDAATGHEMVTDVQPKAGGLNKIKVAAAAALAVVAIAITATMFTPKSAPVQAPQAGPNSQSVPTPNGSPQLQPAPATPVGPGVGIDIGDTKAISLETGDFDMIEQWRPVAPANQTCAAQAMSGYLQAVCKAAGVKRYFECAPDGYHWDPRISGCAQV